MTNETHYVEANVARLQGTIEGVEEEEIVQNGQGTAGQEG
jgi:hypothetical protein